jgi:GAF domain-containing protein/DNA-binding response OmpR family regulator
MTGMMSELSTRSKRPKVRMSRGFQKRIMRRIALVIVVAFAVLTAGAVVTVQMTSRNNLRQSSEHALAVLASNLQGQLEEPVRDLVGIATGSTMRRYARLTSVSSAAQFDDDQAVLQADVLRAFDDLISRGRDRFLAVRFIPRDGFSRGEVINLGNETHVITEVGETAYWDDPAYVAASTTAMPGTAYLGPVQFRAGESGEGVFAIYVPVTAAGNIASVLGVIQMEVTTGSLDEYVMSALQDTLVSQSGRRVMLVNRENRVIAATHSEMQSDEGLLQFLDSNSGRLSQTYRTSTMIVSAEVIDRYDGMDTPWRVVMVDDLLLALGYAHQLSITLVVIGLVAALLLLALVNVVIRTMLLPLAIAAEKAQHLAEGRISAVDDDATRISTPADDDEIHELLGSIGGISQRIADLTESLSTQVDRRTRDLEVASRIGREVATLHEINALLNRAIDLICDEFDVYHAQVFLIDDVGIYAVLAHSRGEIGRQLLAENYKIEIGSETVIGKVTAEGAPVVVNDTAHPGVPHKHNPLLPETRAELGLPLMIADQIIGALDIQSKEPDVFQEADLSTYRLLADQLTVAIYNARLVSQTDKRLQQIDMLNRQLTRTSWAQVGQHDGLQTVYRYNLLEVEREETAHLEQTPNSGLHSPISIRGEVIGTLEVASPEGQELTEGDQVVLSAVANRIALALENARLFQETQVSLTETSTLYQLSRYLNEADALEDILQAIIIAVVPDACGAQVWVFDEDYIESPKWLTVIADLPMMMREENDEDLNGLRIYLPEHPFFGQLTGDQVALVNDISNDSRLDDDLKALFHRMGGAAVVFIPLSVRGLWRGFATIEFPEPREYSDDEGRIYSALIDQAGVAIENRLLLQQTEREVARNENLYTASRIINTAQNMQDLVYALVETSVDTRLTFSLSLLEGELDATGWPSRARVVARSQGDTVQPDDTVFYLDIAPDSPIRQSEPEIIYDENPRAKKVSRMVKFIRSQKQRFMMTLPLFSANQPIAFFHVMAAEIIEFSASDLSAYRALAGQMSSQIQIRRLLERTETALDETRRLYLASRAVATASNAAEVYKSAVEHLAQPFTVGKLHDAADFGIEMAVLLAWPEASVDAPYLEYAYRWSSNDGEIELVDSTRLESGEYPYGRLTASVNGSLYLSDIPRGEDNAGALTDAAHLHDRLNAAGIGSMVVLPLSTRQRWFGVLLVQSNQTNAFDGQYRRFAQAVADQIALAVENQRLFEEARYEAERAQLEAQRALALSEAAQLASRITDDLANSMEEVFERVAQVAGFNRWILVLFDESGAQLEKLIVRGPGVDPDERISYDLSAEVPLVDAVRLNQTLIVNDISSYPSVEAYTGAEIEHFESFFGKHIAVPVVTGRQMLGALFMGRDMAGSDLDDGDRQLVQTLATQVAVALENRRFFEQAQSEQQTLRSILETLPAGVLVLDAQTLQPIQYNEQVRSFLGHAVSMKVPFSTEKYNLYRTGTQLYYPDTEMPILAALRTGTQMSSDDVAAIVDNRQIDLLVDAAPITDSQGNVTAIVAAFQDISNLRSLESTLQENLRETVALYEAQRELVEATNLEEVLDVTIVQLAQLQTVDAYVLLVEDDGEAHTARHLVLPFDQPQLLANVLSPNQITHIGDITQDELAEELRQTFEAMGVRSLMGAPLRSATRNQAIGWIVVVSEAVSGFTVQQERLLIQLADAVSTAADNRLLIQTQQATVQEVLALYDASTKVSRARDLEQVRVVIQDALMTLQPDYASGYLSSIAGMQAGGLYLVDLVSQNDLPPVDFRALMADFNLPPGGMYINDLQVIENPNPLEQALLDAGIRSLAAVALRSKDTSNGFLAVAYRQPHQFQDRENRYLNTIADGASIVFDNIILLDQIQNTLEETSVLYQASRALSEVTTSKEILEVMVNYLIQPHVDQVFIVELTSVGWDVPGATVRVVASWTAAGEDWDGLMLTVDEFAAWRQLSSPAVLMVDDIQADPNMAALEQAAIEGMGARSLAIIPLRVPKRVIGAVWIGSSQPHIHTDREMRTYQAFAETASLSMEAGYLLQQTERRARQLQTSADVSQSAGQILDLQVLLPQLVDLIKGAFGYDHVQIFLMDEVGEYAELRASTGEAGRQLLGIRHKLQKGSDSVIGMVTAIGQPQIALDTADADVIHYPNPYLPLTRSEMALPLIVQERVIGALDVQSNQPNAFNEEDVKVLTTLAAQISVAIDNANLYEAAQQQADKMGFLFEVTSAATAADTLEEALQNVAERLHEMLSALSVIVYMPRLYVDSRDNPFTMLQAVALAGADQPLSEIEEILADDPENLISEVGRNMKAFVIDNVVQEVRYLPVVSAARSAVILPLVSSNELVGVIVMEDRRSGAFDYDVLQLLLTLAGALSAVVQSARLLEQLQHTNEQLRELDRLKSDFLANMSHELRTPLNSIIGFSRVMLKGIDGPLTEMQEQDLTTIYNSGQHLLMLINDVLDQAKIAAGKMDLKFAYFDIKPVVEAVKSIGIGLVKDKKINMLMEVAPNLPQAYGDEFRIRQVLLNMVSNAAKFTNEGAITLRIYPVRVEDSGKTMVRIDVEDTGIGINEKDQPLLFEAFRQIDSSLTRTQGGTGLGLPIAKSLIEMQGGQMTVTSEVNVGSTFSILIPTESVVNEDQDEAFDTEDELTPATKPTVEIRLHPALAEPAANIVHTKREILLIEDNKDMVDQFRRTLQREGFEVQTADHPSYAEAIASNMRPTVIVMDVNFADGEGWNILLRLKERDDTFDIPIVVVSLSDESERAYRAGAYRFIQRPFVPDDLIEVVLEAERESNTGRILIIDDQPESIRLMTQLLQEEGKYNVFTAESGLEGISLVARRRPDLIILDLRMPEMDGFTVLQELRANPETANIPVMIVTGEIDLTSDEQKQLVNVHVMQKTDISQEEFDRFMKDVRKHLNLHEEK